MADQKKTQTIPFLGLILVQFFSIVFYGIFTEYSKEAQIHESEKEGFIYRIYEPFQDIHVMMFIGFGFLMTFLKKFWFSSLGMNFWIAAFALQWSILIDGFFERLITNDLDHWHTLIQIDVKSFVNGDFAAASCLICFGALLGKVSLNQITLLVFMQLIFYSLNLFIAVVHLQIADIGGSMIIHTFGAYFGLAASRILTNQKTLISSADVQGSNYISDLFSMVGTLFLWMYWPSFNGAFADYDARERVVIHTVLSLTHSCLFAFIISRLVNKDHKFDMIHIQNSSLAGGVAIGAVANLVISPFSAMIIGGLSGTISVLGYKYLQPLLEKQYKLHDTCGVHNLHGIPGIIGGVASAIAAGAASYETYGENLYVLFPMVAKGRSCLEQGAYQILCLVITLILAVVSGTFSGYVVKYITKSPSSYFQDQFFWEGAEGYIPVKKAPKNIEERFKLEEKVRKEDAVTRHHNPTTFFQQEQVVNEMKLKFHSKKSSSKHEEDLKNINLVENIIEDKRKKDKANNEKKGKESELISADIREMESPVSYRKVNSHEAESKSPNKEQRPAMTVIMSEYK